MANVTLKPPPDPVRLQEALRLHARFAANRPGGIRASFKFHDLSGISIPRHLLAGIDLTGARLCNVDLSGCDLTGAILYGADLSGANLDGAILIQADLRGAILNRSRIRHADLTDVDMREGMLLAQRAGSLVPTRAKAATQAHDAQLFGSRLAGARMTRSSLAHI